MKKPSIEAALGMSRKWDARAAGREVAETAIHNLREPPNFFLLFSTIHYKDYGGFQELLDGVWDVLPKGTPLLGGTVTGFMNNYGCYSRGVTALSVASSQLEVSIGVGSNTKRNPKKATEQCSETIQKELSDTEYSRTFLLNFSSGPEMPHIPGVGQKKVIRSGLLSKFGMTSFGFSQTVLQKGLGREDEIFEEFVQKFPGSYQVLGTSMDDYKGAENYQFYNNQVLSNSVVSLGLATDLDLDVCTTHGMKETDLTFEITRLGMGNHAIQEINHKPAVPEFLRLLGWPESFLTEETMINTILYYPISLRRHGREVPVVMPLILGDSIVVPCIIDSGKVSILTVSGKRLLDASHNNLDSMNHIIPAFGLGSQCITILQTLGDKMNMIKDIFSSYFNDKPFLMFFSAGEGTYSPDRKLTYANMSFNTAVFGQKK